SRVANRRLDISAGSEQSLVLRRQGVGGWRRGRNLTATLSPVLLSLIAVAAEHADVVVPVGLHQPEAQEGAVAVEHDRGIGADARARQDLLEIRFGYWTVGGIAEVAIGVPEN